MCTASRIAVADGMRLVFTRDEQRRRAPSMPPRVHNGPSTKAIWPIDAAAGGTWIAATDAGLVFALLNRTDSAETSWTGGTGEVSRGKLIRNSLRPAPVTRQSTC